MRQLWIRLGLVSLTLALPSLASDSQKPVEIVRLSQAEVSQLPRLLPGRLGKRHEHHEDEDSISVLAHEAYTAKDTEEENVSGGGQVESISPTPKLQPSLAGHSHVGTIISGGGGEHDHHHSRDPPKLMLDEDEILKTHAPDPPSYYDLDKTEDGMPRTMVAHIVLMSLAFFGLLPLAIFLKAGGSQLSVLPQIGFLLLSLLGLLLGRIYSWSTPERYEGSSHSSWGWATMIFAFALNSVDVARFVLKFARLEERLDSFFSAFKRKTIAENEAEESIALVESPAEEYATSRWSIDQNQPSPSSSRGNSSTFSDSDTIYDSSGPAAPSLQSLDAKSDSSPSQAFVSKLLDLATRLLIVLAYVNVLNGVSVYTGICRGNYINGCMAHSIKGSIFFWYGLLTFSRYCGGMSTLGWAWNRRPEGDGFTAEFVESFVIFLYGSTQTWMERLGKTGDYSVKDVQHISIAIMFWAAGALGMLLENRTIRSWLAAPATEASSRDLARITQPASSSFSFNPFPALVIGVTGIAMSAHHQTYQFQVEIHALWGYLLAAFSVFRFLTYFFLYLRPPASILPSRPPTEALASLFLACGGVVFVLSTEQVTFAAMRHQADDMMAFLNVTFAFVCTIFLWLALLFGIKGWALKRNSTRAAQNPPVKSA